MDLVRLADNLTSKYARISRADEDGSVPCVCCGIKSHWGSMDCAHFIGRSCFLLRFSIDNTYPCHRTCHTSPDHLVKYEAALVKEKGQAFVDSLKLSSKKYHKNPNTEEMMFIIDSLTTKLLKYASK